MPFILKLLATSVVKRFALEAIGVLVRRTDNKLDDEFYEAFRKAVLDA